MDNWPAPETFRMLATPLLLALLIVGLLWLAIIAADTTARAGVVTAAVGGLNHWLGTRAALKIPGQQS